MTKSPRDMFPPSKPQSLSKSEDEDKDDTPESGALANAKTKGSTPSTVHEIHFSFGPRRSYFMHLRNRWWFHGSQSICDKLDDTGVNNPYVVALGPDDTYFIACENSKNAPLWSYSLPKGSGENIKTWKKGRDTQWVISTESRGDAWKTLQSWISNNFTCDHDALKNSTMVFGTGNTYYTKTPKGCLWNNIPADLEKTIIDHMSDRGPPSDVCLGVNETWAVFWDNGRIQWNLKSYYNSVHQKLLEDTGKITCLVLDPYSSDFFVHYKNGMLVWSVQFDLENGARRNFVQRCQAYMQKRAREDGSTFKLESWTSGSKMSKYGYVISPSTKWDVVTEDTIPGNVLRLLPIPASWSERVRQTAASSGWSTAAWSGAALGVFGTVIDALRKGRRFFRK